MIFEIGKTYVSNKPLMLHWQPDANDFWEANKPFIIAGKLKGVVGYLWYEIAGEDGTDRRISHDELVEKRATEV
jgi:hypothetical protein